MSMWPSRTPEPVLDWVNTDINLSTSDTYEVGKVTCLTVSFINYLKTSQMYSVKQFKNILSRDSTFSSVHNFMTTLR